MRRPGEADHREPADPDDAGAIPEGADGGAKSSKTLCYGIASPEIIEKLKFCFQSKIRLWTMDIKVMAACLIGMERRYVKISGFRRVAARK